MDNVLCHKRNEQHQQNWRNNWVVAVVSNICYFHPYVEKWSNLTNSFRMSWNHQTDKCEKSLWLVIFLANFETDLSHDLRPTGEGTIWKALQRQTFHQCDRKNRIQTINLLYFEFWIIISFLRMGCISWAILDESGGVSMVGYTL